MAFDPCGGLPLLVSVNPQLPSGCNSWRSDTDTYTHKLTHTRIYTDTAEVYGPLPGSDLRPSGDQQSYFQPRSALTAPGDYAENSTVALTDTAFTKWWGENREGAQV